MKRILLTSAGGRLAITIARALKAAPEPYYMIGVDASEFTLQRALTDEKHLVTRTNNPNYVELMQSIIAETQPDLMLVCITAEMQTISASRSILGCKTFLPDHQTIVTCDDKIAAANLFSKAGVPSPVSIKIDNKEDLRRAFNEIGNKLWLRATYGSAGKGSLPVNNFEDAVEWIDSNDGWGGFMAAKLLQDRTVSWESVWRDGELIVAQSREREYWEYGRLAPSGISGIAGAAHTVHDNEVTQVGLAAVKAIDSRPNGILGVDMAYDDDGVPNVTEINAGRFMSGGVCHFALNSVNVPEIVVRCALGENLGFATPWLDPVPADMVYVSGLDVEPVITTVEGIQSAKHALENRMNRLAVARK